jgi:5-phospho-D-xylono-1,4-lactonase
VEKQFYKQLTEHINFIMTFVRTVLGDISSQQMGLTYSHEHVVIEESFPTMANKDFILNDVVKISEELKEFYKCGGRTLVDTMPADCGRNVLKLVQVSKISGVHIIAPTGIHLQKYYPPNHWQYYLPEDELTELLVKDITEGIDEFDYGCPVVKRSAHKAGLIKLATGEGAFTEHEKKIFRCVVAAHKRTGAPILTHTSNGKQAVEQVELFLKLGADIKHIVLSHVDRNKDLGYHKLLMQTGVYVEYDSHFRRKNEDDNWTYILLEKLLPDFADQITVGMDMARNTYWQSYGGAPGLNYLLTTFRQQMKKRDLSAYLEKIFFTNPQELFCFNQN